MNSRKQAAKGFKTFLVTLVISLVIFSGIYYLINSQEEDSNNYNSGKVNEYEDVLGSESDATGNEKLTGVDTSQNNSTDQGDEESVFADLANQKMDNKGQQVLAESDSVDTTATVDTEPTVDTTVAADTTDTTDTTAVAESTVPETGVSGPTMGVIMTILIMGFAAYIMFLGPRNVALHNFERDTVEDLD